MIFAGVERALEGFGFRVSVFTVFSGLGGLEVLGLWKGELRILISLSLG